MIQLLEDAILFSNKNIVKFSFSNKNKYQSYSVGIYCSILELSQSFYELIKSENLTGSLSVYRTFLENFVDLKNLKNDTAYVDQLDYNNLISMKKDFKSAKLGNVYLKPLAKHFDDKLPELLADIEKLKVAMDGKSLNIRDKFVKAQMESEYQGLYPILCSEAHCSVSAILARHFNYDPEKNSIEMVVNSKESISNFDFYLCNMAQQLLDAGAILCDILGDSMLNEYLSQSEVVRESVEAK